VKVLAEFPFGSHPRIVYPVARVAASTHADVTRFLAFLHGDAARALFRERGFTPLD
jgi:molybdate transport system substrate-binding protein